MVVTRVQREPASSFDRAAVVINLAVLAALLLAVEISGRVLLLVSRGPRPPDLQERTLNLEYEPFVMYGPGWDARFAAVPRDGLPTVLLVGGSTAEGLAPEMLEEALRRRFRARCAWSTRPSAATRRDRRSWSRRCGAPRSGPSPIVSLDGQNDLEHRLRVPGARPLLP